MDVRRFAVTATVAAIVLSALGLDQDGSARAQSAQPPPLVAIDPGHGAHDYGTSGSIDGKRLLEKELTLRVSRDLAAALQRAGYRTVLTRSADVSVNDGRERTGDDRVDTADELQARVDRANEARAAVFVSVHFNGSLDRRLRGPEIYYSPARPFAADSQRLGEAIMAATTARLGEAKRPVKPRGVLRDAALGGHLFVLGPAGGKIARASAMPGVLVEGMFLTNDDDLRLLLDDQTIEAMVRGYADGIATFLGPPPKPAPRRARVAGVGGANLRPSPLLGTDPLATLPVGATVELAEAARGDAVGGASDWWRVDWQGKAGYVFGRLLLPLEGGATGGGDDPQPQKQPPPTATPPASVRPTPTPAPPVVPAREPVLRQAMVRTIDDLPARVRQAPRLDSPILARARPGEKLDVIGEGQGDAVEPSASHWLRIRRGDVIGWVWAPLVE